MKTVTIDVRPVIQSGGDPFSLIMSTLDTLGPEDSLLLIAPFQPVPLFRVMAQKGYKGKSEATAAGDWEVLFSPEKKAGSRLEMGSRPQEAPPGGREIIDVDVRGLEPPEPLVKILEAVESAPGSAVLHARTLRRPMHLYAALEERGWKGETIEQPDGSFVTAIQKLETAP
jgi:hypothetical protein